MKLRIRKMLAAALVLAMTVTLQPVSVKESGAVTKAVPQKMATLMSDLSGFASAYLKPEGDNALQIDTWIIKSPEGIAEEYVKYLASLYKGLTYAKPIEGAQGQAVLLTLAKKTFRMFFVSEYTAKETFGPIITKSKVTEVRNSSKKIVLKQVNGKKTMYTEYAFSKLTNETVYAKNGKKYTKNGKKITKKAFNKYATSFKKMKKISMKKAEVDASLLENDHAFYDIDGTALLSQNTYVHSQFYGERADDADTIILNYNKDNATDPYQFFEDRCGELIRYVLAPNVVDPNGPTAPEGTDGAAAPPRDGGYGPDGENVSDERTYQKREWAKAVRYHMDVDYIIHPFFESLLEGQMNDADVEINSDAAQNRYYTVRSNSFNTELNLKFEKGTNKLSYMTVGSMYGAATFIIDFDYEVEGGQFVDPKDYFDCYPTEADIAEDAANLHTFTYTYAGTNKDVPATVTVTAKNNVRFEFPYLSPGAGQTMKTGFYIQLDGKDCMLPLEDEEEEKSGLIGKLNVIAEDGTASTAADLPTIYWKENGPTPQG